MKECTVVGVASRNEKLRVNRPMVIVRREWGAQLPHAVTKDSALVVVLVTDDP